MSSNLKSMGVGIAAEDKNDGSKILAVFPQEHLPSFEGDITADHVTVPYSGTDMNNAAYNISLQKGMSVKAIWKGQPNRETSPNIRKGEQVELFQAGDSDKFYWCEMARDNQYRRTEAVTYSWGANSAATTKDTPATAHTKYTATVDGDAGHMTLTTSAANGEKAKYTAQIHGKQGHLTFADNLGNTIQINSISGAVNIVNSAGTSFSLTGFNVVVKNKNNSYINMAGADITLGGSGTLTINYPTIKLNGNVEIVDNLTVDQKFAAKGTGTIAGDISTNGNITTSGNVQASGSVHGTNI